MGVLNKIPQKVAIFIEAKKYSPGANCKNLIPTAGAWHSLTICLISEKQILTDFHGHSIQTSAKLSILQQQCGFTTDVRVFSDIIYCKGKVRFLFERCTTAND